MHVNYYPNYENTHIAEIKTCHQANQVHLFNCILGVLRSPILMCLLKNFYHSFVKQVQHVTCYNILACAKTLVFSFYLTY